MLEHSKFVLSSGLNFTELTLAARLGSYFSKLGLGFKLDLKIMFGLEAKK